jgi:hypothetical protein
MGLGLWCLMPLSTILESVPITTKVVSSNPVHGEVYSIQHYVTQYISDFRQVGSFRLVLQLPPPISMAPIPNVMKCNVINPFIHI